MGNGKKIGLLVGNIERTGLGDLWQGDLGEKNVVETLGEGLNGKIELRSIR